MSFSHPQFSLLIPYWIFSSPVFPLCPNSVENDSWFRFTTESSDLTVIPRRSNHPSSGNRGFLRNLTEDEIRRIKPAANTTLPPFSRAHARRNYTSILQGSLSFFFYFFRFMTLHDAFFRFMTSHDAFFPVS